MDDVSAWSSLVSQAIETWAPNLLLVLVTLVVGLWIIKRIVKGFRRSAERTEMEPTLQRFLSSLIGVGLRVLLFITVAYMIGIEMTSFVAILGAAGLAVGLALQGSLANFAGGALILMFKPFKVGDFIDTGSHMGSVNEIQIFNTILKTPDNKTIIIPNGQLSNSSVTNFSTEENRRVDMTFGISYSDDIQKAKSVLKSLIDQDDRIFADPAPVIVVSSLGDSSVNITTRAWCKSGDYWNIYFEMQEKVKETFDREQISIPFPQRDVHMVGQ